MAAALLIRVYVSMRTPMVLLAARPVRRLLRHRLLQRLRRRDRGDLSDRDPRDGAGPHLQHRPRSPAPPAPFAVGSLAQTHGFGAALSSVVGRVPSRGRDLDLDPGNERAESAVERRRVGSDLGLTPAGVDFVFLSRGVRPGSDPDGSRFRFLVNRRHGLASAIVRGVVLATFARQYWSGRNRAPCSGVAARRSSRRSSRSASMDRSRWTSTSSIRMTGRAGQRRAGRAGVGAAPHGGRRPRRDALRAGRCDERHAPSDPRLTVCFHATRLPHTGCRPAPSAQESFRMPCARRASGSPASALCRIVAGLRHAAQAARRSRTGGAGGPAGTGGAGARSTEAQAPSLPPTLPTPRAIIDRHIAADWRSRGDPGAHVDSRHRDGVHPSAGMTGTVDVFAAKPTSRCCGSRSAASAQIEEGFDGTVGWSMSPMTGPTLVAGQGARAEDASTPTSSRDLHATAATSR